MSLPSSIKAIRTVPGQGVKVLDVPFGTLEENTHLDPNVVLVKVGAVGLNPTDWKSSMGLFSNASEPVAVGCDGAGVVVAVGSNVTHIAKGDRVFGMVPGCQNPTNSSFAEYVRYDRAVATKMPEGMSDLEGASFPIPHYTAVQALYLRLGLAKPSAPSKEGKTILIWGGATAVGHHAVQLAALSGYTVITTASPANHANLLALGATTTLNYRDPNIVSQIKTAAGSSGVAFALDCVAENGSTAHCIDSIAPAGGSVITLLPPSGLDANRRKDVDASFTIVYTLTGAAVSFPSLGSFPAPEGDNAAALDWVTNELPPLLEGWDSEKGGSQRFKSQRLRVGKGGLEGVVPGMLEMKEGGYKAEKFVFSLT